MEGFIGLLRFAAVGIDHGHIFGHVDGLKDAGAELVGYCPQTSLPALVEKLRTTYPDAPELDRDAIFADPGIDVICIAAIPRDRAGLAVRAMRAGKDVMVDKPGLTTRDQLAEVTAAVAETGRIFSICFSERHSVPAAVKAGHVVAGGAIGQVFQTIGIGPHKKGTVRPDWFWDTSYYGGVIVDIASHQIDQFLHFTGSTSGEVVAAQTGNFGTPEHPAFQDFGDLMLRSDRGAGYIRVDWFTPRASGSGATGGSPSSAPRATLSCASTSTSRAVPVASTCSSRTGRAPSTSTAPTCRSNTSTASSPTCATAARPR